MVIFSTLKRNIKPGNYYWKVVTNNKKLEKQLSSVPYLLTVLSAGKISLASPNNKSTFDLKEKEKVFNRTV